MTYRLKNLIERVLIKRPDAAPDDIRNLVPGLSEKSADEVEKHVAPLRNRRG